MHWELKTITTLFKALEIPSGNQWSRVGSLSRNSRLILQLYFLEISVTVQQKRKFQVLVAGVFHAFQGLGSLFRTTFLLQNSSSTGLVSFMVITETFYET